MARASRQNQAIREFILRNIDAHPKDVGLKAAAEFGVSRQAISGYLKKLIEEGLVDGEGNTRARQYRLRAISSDAFTIKLSAGLPEDHIFRFRILPLMKNVPQNIIDLCQYGFTEMLNNAIDHSASPDAVISYRQTYASIHIMVIDYGVGIFEKIKNTFNLADPRTALLELSKGKLTSDKTRHSGEGIFFTSRMFNEFYILSGHLRYCRVRRGTDDEYDWLIETVEKERYRQGTGVTMLISTDATWTTSEIFNKYAGGDISFRKTHVPVSLGRYPNEQLVSRSQAKRVLARFDEFSEVILDFDGVPEIGQPFADEIFRVFARAHPGTDVIPLRANKSVQRMIEYVQKAGQSQEEEPELPFLPAPDAAG
jgi:anti-sigma regulatory factor (Ser/Thr protein kinase)